MSNIRDSIQKLAAFRDGIRAHRRTVEMAASDPERLGRWWGGRPGSTGQRIIVAALVADALDLSGAALTAFERGRDEAMRAA